MIILLYFSYSNYYKFCNFKWIFFTGMLYWKDFHDKVQNAKLWQVRRRGNFGRHFSICLPKRRGRVKRERKAKRGRKEERETLQQRDKREAELLDLLKKRFFCSRSRHSIYFFIFRFCPFHCELVVGGCIYMNCTYNKYSVLLDLNWCMDVFYSLPRGSSTLRG